MNKYLAILAGVLMLFATSCNNEEIAISKSVTFKVNPNTVIDSYQEYNPGDLTALPAARQLRVRLLVYNKSGKLADMQTAYSKDYTHIINFTSNLTEDEYTAVAITDVVATDGSTEYYTLSDEENLTTTKITAANILGYQYQILGINSVSCDINNKTTDINIDVYPAGALIVNVLSNWNDCFDYNVDVQAYELQSNQRSSSAILNSLGQLNYSIDNSGNNYQYRWVRANRNPATRHAFGYVFRFPMKNVNLRWIGFDSDGKGYLWGQPVTLDVEIGKQYLFELDVQTDEASWKVFTNVDARPLQSKDKTLFLDSEAMDEMDNLTINLSDYVDL